MPNLTKGDEPLNPYLEVERSKCPFYGFNGMWGSLLDSQGNQCALITTSYSPCQMEMAGQQPSWNLCPMHRDSTEEQIRELEELAKRTRIFPREFHPPEIKSW